jgi:YggT family protein
MQELCRQAVRLRPGLLLPQEHMALPPAPRIAICTRMNTLIMVALYLLTIVWWVIIIQAVMSWLIAFNVINTHNDFVRNVWQTLDRLTEPLYRPIRRIMPDFGAFDLSPIVVLIGITILDIILRNQIQPTTYIT